MAEIHLLSKEISELIAAGEVIERPSSVVKELIENSIDSGADSITVEIKNGGITYIRITDNGCGIAEKDVPTAFLRHATSKISSKDDLDKIFTLGFRGEALASIAAVSKVDILTKQAADQYGTHFVMEGTEEILLEQSGCPNGTTIVIKDIFYNVPARLKFLKKDVTEGNSISSIVNKVALSHPEISFKLIRDNKQDLCTPGDGDVFSAIYAVFGKQFARTLIPVNYTNQQIKVTGYVVKPSYARANRAFQNFFINSRYVKSTTCTVSLEEAYRNSIMTGKFPACILNITVPPSVVDVNVHPAKIEVRFSDEKMIFDSVYFAVKNALMTEDAPKELAFTEKKSEPATQKLQQTSAVTVYEQEYKPSQMTFRSEQKEYNKSEPEQESVSDENVIIPKTELSDLKPEPEKDFSQFKYINKSSFEKKSTDIQEEAHEETEENIRVIGEAFLNYIIAEVNDELLLIDKHAAHERLIFEDLKSRSGSLDSQMFLVPVEVLLSYEEYDAVMNHLDIMTELGFSVESGTAPNILVKGVPVCLDSADTQDIISEVSENILKMKQNPQSDCFDDLYHSIACKSAIKANDKNDIRELKALVNKIYGNERIKYCPHGRPVMIKLTKKELEKQFKRIV